MIIDLTEDEEVVPSSEEQPTAAPGAGYASSMSPALPIASNADAPRNFPTFSKPNSYIPAWSGLNRSYHKQTLQSYRNVIASNVTEGGNFAAYSRNATLAAPQSAISNQIPISGPFSNNPLHVSQQHYPMTIEKQRVYPPALDQSKPVSAYEANMASRAMVTNTVTNRIAVSDRLIVRFSVLDHQYFTARVESGQVTAPIVECLKRTPGAKFDLKASRWCFPFSSHQILSHALSRYWCIVEEIPMGVMAAAQLRTSISSIVATDVASALIPYLGERVMSQLAPFQLEAVKFILDKKGRALIADEMGLGKTRTAIGGAMLYQDDWPVLVVCPSSARFHWQAELLAVLSPHILDPREVTVVENGQHSILSASAQFSYKFVIVSYTLVNKLLVRLQQSNFGIVIADESHYLKTRKAQRTKALLPLIHTAKRALLLSGTPALSRPVELFTQLHALLPKVWSDFKSFGKRYCVDPRPSKDKSLFNSHNRFQYGENAFKGANNTQELHVLLTSTIMLRRLKKDILKQLPQKRRYLVKVNIEDENTRRCLQASLVQLAQYEELLTKKKASRAKRRKNADYNDDENFDTAEDLPAKSDDPEMDPLKTAKSKRKSLLMELFRDSGIAKLSAIWKQLQRLLEMDSAGKVLVFAHHRNVLDALCRYLRDQEVEYIRIDGMTASSERHQRTQQFQTNPAIRVAVLGITAAGIALTLTAANLVFFAELFWTPGSLVQAEDRAHRIGQVRDVKIFYFFANSSIDELLWPLVRKKLQLLGEIVEGKLGLDLAAQSKEGVIMEAKRIPSQGKLQGSENNSKLNSSSSSSSSVDAAHATVSHTGAAAIEASTEANSIKKRKGTDNVYEDAQGRQIFDLLEDDDDFEELMIEMVRESTCEFQEQISDDSSDAGDNDDDDGDEQSQAPDVYEEYLKRTIPPDKLAIFYLNELADKEKHRLETLRQKYAQQEEMKKTHPELSLFMSASQMMEGTLQLPPTSQLTTQPQSQNTAVHGSASMQGSPASIESIEMLSKEPLQHAIIDLMDSDNDDYSSIYHPVTASEDLNMVDTFENYSNSQLAAKIPLSHLPPLHSTSTATPSLVTASNSSVDTEMDTRTASVGFNKLKEAIKRFTVKAALVNHLEQSTCENLDKIE
jgi:SWI/SNF-related matrix-associated actin-dependent regulator 1 of chromatin subfamily A